MSAKQRPTRRRRPIAKSLLVILTLLSAGTALWFGLLPRALNPLPGLILSESNPWFVDFRIAALRRDKQLCAATLTEPQIIAHAIEDNPIRNGCGWENAVRVSATGGASLPVGSLTCEMAAAMALWVEHDVQPLARELFGAQVERIEHMGGYACRNIIGSKMLTGFRSQHATANAIDISGFRLRNGHSIRLAQHWKGEGADARFLREVHRRACRYFRIALGPEFNAAHHDHFHFDRGPFVRCR